MKTETQQLSTVSIMNKLKMATHHLHDEVEKLAFIKEIMSGTLSLSDYYSLILHNYVFHLIVEEAILRGLSKTELIELDFVERRKIGYLYADLEQHQEIGQQVGTKINQLANELVTKFAIDNFYEGIGALYVLEGATLGGNIIKRELSKIPEIMQQTTIHYYGCYGKNQGIIWKSFKENVERLITSPMTEQQAINGAIKTFDLLATILKQGVNSVL